MDRIGMQGGFSRAESSSEGAFVLIAKGCPSGQPSERDTGWIPAPIHRRISEAASVPERCLNHGWEPRRQDFFFYWLFSHTKPPLLSVEASLRKNSAQSPRGEAEFKGHGLRRRVPPPWRN